MRSVYTMEPQSAITHKISFVRKWMQLETNSLSKSSEPQKDKYCALSFIVDPRSYGTKLKVKLKPGGQKIQGEAVEGEGR